MAKIFPPFTDVQLEQERKRLSVTSDPSPHRMMATIDALRQQLEESNKKADNLLKGNMTLGSELFKSQARVVELEEALRPITEALDDNGCLNDDGDARLVWEHELVKARRVLESSTATELAELIKAAKAMKQEDCLTIIDHDEDGHNVYGCSGCEAPAHPIDNFVRHNPNWRYKYISSSGEKCPIEVLGDAVDAVVAAEAKRQEMEN